MSFRPYYAYLRARYNENKEIITDIEKCYVDDPNSWSKQARSAIELQLTDGKKVEHSLTGW